MNQTLPPTANENKAASVNERLLQSISDALEKGKNPALVLQNLLKMGKDAVYRRLRGDVAFTLDELIVICNELGIGLDSVIYGVETGRAVFDLEETAPEQGNSEAFVQMLEAHTTIWETDGCKFTAACPFLPEFIIMRFPKLSRCRLYAEHSGLNTPYNQFLAPEQFKNIQTAYNRAFSEINSLELLFDDDLFSPFIKEINYFEKLGMLTAGETTELYKEMSLAADVLEAAAASGSLPGTKNSVNMYLSHAGIGTEIWLLENNLHDCTAWLSPYPGKSIRTQNKQVCRNHKARIDEIKRFSTYITRSGEMARREFFAGLREKLRMEN